MTFRLNRIASDEFTPRLQKLFNKAFGQIENSLNSLQDAIDAVAAAQAAADAANTAAAAANTAAATAQTTADDISAGDALAKSYVSGTPPIISAADAGTDVTITIAAHTRHYPQPDGTTVDVSVSGGTLTTRAYSTTYYIYYDQPSRAGGSVSYQSTTSDATAAQIGDRHCVGAVATPAAAGSPTDGAYTRPPGPGAVGQLP